MQNENPGLEVVNVSGQVSTIGSTTRHTERGNDGRWKPRAARRVGPLGPAGGVGPGGIDVTTGQWVPGVEDRSVLTRQNDMFGVERIHQLDRQARELPSYAAAFHQAEHAINDRLAPSCPICSVLGG
jgi:hypothetical protein